MNKKGIGFIIGFFLFVGLFFLLLGNSQPQVQSNKEDVKSDSSKPFITNADKIEVIHFHATQQCWACVTLGEYALKAIEQELTEQYDEGIITFQTANVDASENRELASKYQARGSSLFINAIVDDEDNIEEDINVWRYIMNEEQFIEYFSDKLHQILGEE